MLRSLDSLAALSNASPDFFTRPDKLLVNAGCDPGIFSVIAILAAFSLAISDKFCGTLASNLPNPSLTALNAEPDTPLTESNRPVNALFASSSALREFAIPPNPPKLSASLAADTPAPIAPATSAAPVAALVNAVTDFVALFTRFTAGCAARGEGIPTALAAAVRLAVAVSTDSVATEDCFTASTTASVPKAPAAAIKPAV